MVMRWWWWWTGGDGGVAGGSVSPDRAWPGERDDVEAHARARVDEVSLEAAHPQHLLDPIDFFKKCCHQMVFVATVVLCLTWMCPWRRVAVHGAGGGVDGEVRLLGPKGRGGSKPQTPPIPTTRRRPAAEMAAGDAARAPPAAEAQSLVESFCGVTSATPQEAAFFLESHNWALESAVRSFYDSADGDASAAAADAADPPPRQPPPPPPASDGADSDDEDYVVGGGDEDQDDEDYVGDGDGDGEGDDDDDEDAALAAEEAAASDERRRPLKRLKRGQNARGGSGSGKGNVRTLSDLGGGKDSAGSEDSEDDEYKPPQELYTGGEKSGMVVRDRSKRKNRADEIFKEAKRKGAKKGSFEARRKSKSFAGTGRLLTGESAEPVAPQSPESIVHNIYFWTNGFTVNDGPLRSFDDPANASFLKSIKNSECPSELEPADKKSQVNVNLVRKEEKCPEPVKRAAPFHGAAKTLGTPSDNNSTPPEATSAAAAASSTETASKTVTITVDDSLPSTSLQIRFVDGSRMVARFNTSHTIADVRVFIDTTRPGEAGDYTLQAGFPPKPLDDMSKTIEEAGVANSNLDKK
uniref:UBX domain-containing protein n=1 Tax=Oryza nivara TaxID=4536 RepID=A0A0E0HTV6_ORYNI